MWVKMFCLLMRLYKLKYLINWVAIFFTYEQISNNYSLNLGMLKHGVYYIVFINIDKSITKEIVKY